MKPTEILHALLEGNKVKLTEQRKKEMDEPYKEVPTINEFTIYQIESYSVNLYNEETAEVYHDFSFEDISLL